jgi:hypothetical protein
METTFVAPIVAAGSSLLTAGLGYLRRRARPVIIIDEITLSASPTPQSTVALPNFELAALCADSEFVTVELGPREPLDEAEYITRLRKALDETRTASSDLPTLHQVAGALNDCLQREDYLDYAELFSRESPRLWPSLTSARGRGSFRYEGDGPPPDIWRNHGEPSSNSGQQTTGDINHLADHEEVMVTDTPTKDRVLDHDSWTSQIVIDSDGEFIMPIDGPRDLGFPWTETNSGQRARVYAFAMRTAVAVAAEHKADLQQLTSYLLKVEKEHSATLERLEAKLKAELKKYDRLVVKGIIANRGGSPVSATNTANLFVGLVGQPFTETADGRTRSQTHPKNVEVDMRLGAERLGGEIDFESSLTVERKSVMRFIASSSEPVDNFSYAPALLAAMTGGERECYLGALVVSPRSWWARVLQNRRSDFTPCYTDLQNFKDSESGIRVPPREAHWRLARRLPKRIPGRRSRQ